MSKNIKKIRQALGMSQSQFSRAINIQVMTISVWELGKQVISAKNAAKVAQYATYAGVPTTLDDIYGMPKAKPIKKGGKYA